MSELPHPLTGRDFRIAVIGASAGGVEAMMKLARHLPRDTRFPVVVVMHLPPRGQNLLPSLLSEMTELQVKEAESTEVLRPGCMYIAPPGYHLQVERDSTLSLSLDEPVLYSRPSIDVLFETAAEAFQENSLGVLLSGANEDGAAGIHLIHRSGGGTVVQDPRTAHMSMMPEAALSRFKPDLVADLETIGKTLSILASGGAPR